jgi:hypothetical protein
MRDDGKIPFPQASDLCHQKRVDEVTTLLALAAAAAAAAASMLALALRGRTRRLALLERENEALREQGDRLALLERREAACAPLDLLALCWTRCAPPDEAMLHDAAAAARSACSRPISSRISTRSPGGWRRWRSSGGASGTRSWPDATANESP